MDDYGELTGEAPALTMGAPLNLSDLAGLGGQGVELSTGLILTWQRRLVFGVEPRAIPLGAQGRQDVAAFTGIGGHLEPGEGWTQAVVREALEEACCTVSLGDSPVTYFCQQDQTPFPIAFRWTEGRRPLLVWVATFQLRRGPERRLVPVTMVNAVFRAAALNRPAPCAEIQALILLDPEMLLHAYAEPQPLARLQAMGAEIVGPPLPPEMLLAPGGSAFFYAQWLAWQRNG